VSVGAWLPSHPVACCLGASKQAAWPAFTAVAVAARQALFIFKKSWGPKSACPLPLHHFHPPRRSLCLLSPHCSPAARTFTFQGRAMMRRAGHWASPLLSCGSTKRCVCVFVGVFVGVGEGTVVGVDVCTGRGGGNAHHLA